MSIPVPITSSALRTTVTGTHAEIGAMVDGEVWIFTPTVACYIQQGPAPVATAGNGSTLISAGESVALDGLLGAKVSVLRATTDGEATLTKVRFLK